MKDQYFADERDFLKYDLWMELANHTVERPRLTFVPMLTRPDGTRQGGKTKYAAGERRRSLYDFLQTFCLPENKNKRSMTELRRFFESGDGCDFCYHASRDGTRKGLDHFDHEKREEYFAGIPRDLLTGSVVLIDPDTGLETETRYWKKRPERCATYANIIEVAKEAAGDSILIVVQFPQRNANRAASDLDDRVSLLCEKLRSSTNHRWSVHWIAQKKGTKVGDLAFFVTAPRGLSVKVKELLQDYARRHDMLLGVPR